MKNQVKLSWLRVPEEEPPGPDVYDLLNSRELARATRFKVERPRRVFVAGRSALRTVLGAELGADPRSLIFATGPHGKPRLEPRSGLEFNLAHSGSTVAIATTRGTALGVDIEEIRHEVPALRLAQRFFSEAEATVVANTSAALRLKVFFHFWTAKEAVLKATGSGLTVPVREIEISLDPFVQPRVRKVAGKTDEAAGWRLIRYERPGEWMATIAHQGNPRELEVSEFTAL